MTIWKKAFAFLLTFFLAHTMMHTSLSANNEKASRIVLASFPTFEEAKKELKSFGDSVDPSIVRSAQQNHFEIAARVSGKAYILVIEPINNQEIADVVLQRLNKSYPDAYIAPYFGPTQGAVFYPLSSIEKQSLKSVAVVESNESCSQTDYESDTDNLFGWSIVILVLVGLVIAGLRRFGLRSNVPTVSAEEPTIRANNIQKDLDVPIWRFEDALKRSSGDDALLKEQIEQFLIHAPRMIAALRKMVAAGDLVGLKSNAHILKGLAASIAAHALRIASKNIEFAARDENRTLIDIVFVRCEKIAKETIEVIEEARANNLLQAKKDDLEAPEIQEQLHQMSEQMIRSIFIDTDQYELFHHEWDESMGEMVAELKVKINRLEFDMALDQIIKIKKVLGYE